MNEAQKANLRIETIFAHIFGFLPKDSDNVRYGPFEKIEERFDNETQTYIQVFTRHVQVGSGFLQQSRVSIIGLIFRKNTYDATNEHDLYALTSHNDWQAFSNVIDHQFSERVHSRLLEPEVQRVVYQDLIGNGLYTDKTFKNPKKLEPDRFFDKFLIEITSRLKPNAPIFSLKSFHNQSNSQVTVKREALRFTVPLPFAEYIGLIDCLSKIYHEKSLEDENNTTYTLQKYLKPVSDAKAKLLDEHLQTVLWNAFEQGSYQGLFLCHTFEDTFVQATKFSLFFQGSLIHECKGSFTASNILQELRNHLNH